jgi:hypothetical protein
MREDSLFPIPDLMFFRKAKHLTETTSTGERTLAPVY